jgi:osmotically-inducible protein OsmY
LNPEARLMQATSDYEITAAILRALETDPLLPRYAVQVTVQSGWIVLAGEVHRPMQRWVAEADARCLPGVAGVDNRIIVRS